MLFGPAGRDRGDGGDERVGVGSLLGGRHGASSNLSGTALQVEPVEDVQMNHGAGGVVARLHQRCRIANSVVVPT